MNLVIWGTGNIGELVAYILSYNPRVHIRGFVDDDPESHGKLVAGCPVFEPSSDVLETLRKEGATHGIVAIGNGRLREELSHKFETAGYQIASVIHPTAHISSPGLLGKGVIICSRANLFYNPVIGNYVYIAPSVTVTHDTSIEDNVELCAGVVVGARVHIQRNAYLGIGATVVPKDFGHLTIGENAFVGAGALALDDVEPNTVVVGRPAKFLRWRD